MNFLDHVDNDKLKLVNTINTISKNLCAIFNLRNRSDNTEEFYANISGLSSISARIKKDRIYFSVVGLEKYRIGFDDNKTESNLKDNLFLKLITPIDDYSIGGYSMPNVTISFSELNSDIVKDIMLLVNGTKAELRATKYDLF